MKDYVEKKRRFTQVMNLRKLQLLQGQVQIQTFASVRCIPAED